MQLEFTWHGCDSALAAPLVLGLARLAAAAQAAGRTGPLTDLAFFFEDPLGAAGGSLAERVNKPLENRPTQRVPEPIAGIHPSGYRQKEATMITDETEVESWLREFIGTYGGVAGSVHVRQGEGVALAAAVNLPPKVREVTAFVPRGKGMAGLALERGVAVQSCNIQTDGSGDVRPGARAVNAQAAVALPVRDENGDVVAIVGIAFASERAEFLGAELQWMENHARALLDRVQDICQ